MKYGTLAYTARRTHNDYYLYLKLTYIIDEILKQNLAYYIRIIPSIVDDNILLIFACYTIIESLRMLVL